MEKRYPLWAELYRIGDATYRRPPYRGDTHKAQPLPPGGDTVDRYADSQPDEDEPVCGFRDEAYERRKLEEKVQKVPRIVADVKGETIEPPPGFELKVPLPAPVADIPDVPAPSASLSRDSRVTIDKDGKWTATISVPFTMHGLLIGTKGQTIKDIQDATQCKVSTRRREEKSDRVTISSAVGEENVTRAIERIEVLIHKSRSKANATHFASIPLAVPSIRERFLDFKEQVLESQDISDSCRKPTLFPSEDKLHLTLTMLQLLTEDEKARAAILLKKFAEKERDRFRDAGGAPQLFIQGLDFMNDDTKNVHVLFARIHGDDVQDLANRVRDMFVEERLAVKPDVGDVKLHMTVMNSRYAANSFDLYTREAFDVTELVEKFRKYEFGWATLSRITVCCLDTVADDGYYKLLVNESVL